VFLEKFVLSSEEAFIVEYILEVTAGSDLFESYISNNKQYIDISPLIIYISNNIDLLGMIEQER